MIPALTLYRPWPALIFRAGKDVENRGWPTKYRGPLLLHAGQRWDHSAIELASEIRTGDDTVALNWISQDPDDHPTGIIGVARLWSCVRDDAVSPWAMPNQWHWRLQGTHEFPTPIPCPGKQQLWTPPAELQPALAAALQAVGVAG
jgi:hypothetical protein